MGRTFSPDCEDTVRLLSEALGKIADTPRTHIVTRKQLSNAVDAMMASLDSLPVDSVDWANRFKEWSAHAQTVADIAQALAQEHGGDPESELRTWADAFRACVESHFRDAEILIPWTRLDPKDIASIGQESSRPSTRMEGDRTVAALRSHARGCTGQIRYCSVSSFPRCALVWWRVLHRDPKTIARIDALAEALRRLGCGCRRAHSPSFSHCSRRQADMFQAMDFGFLFDDARKLFSIGYRVADGSLDPNCYDLLASEARLASFIAIAKGEAPPSHWFHLGRALTPVGRGFRAHFLVGLDV